MENLQNIGQSFLFYSFLKRLKASIVDVKSYYPEIIALSSDILLTKLSEKMASLEELLREPEKIEINSISQIYFSFYKNITDSKYIQRLSACLIDFSHSLKHPINQLNIIIISQELKDQILAILKKADKNIINEKAAFPIYNSQDNIYQRKNQKINFVNEILKIFEENNIYEIPVNFKSSLLQFQKIINNKTDIQKILQMKPFFNRKNINLNETQNTNECSDSEIDSEYSGSASGSDLYLKPNTDIKVNDITSECDKTSVSENENSYNAQNEYIIKIKNELDSVLGSLKSAVSENECLKTKIEKIEIEKIELNQKLQDADELRKEQIKAVEENALLKKENEKLKNRNIENSSSTISLIIASSSNLNNICELPSKDPIISNDLKQNITKNFAGLEESKDQNELKESNDSEKVIQTKELKTQREQNESNKQIESREQKDQKETILNSKELCIKDGNSKKDDKSTKPPKEQKKEFKAKTKFGQTVLDSLKKLHFKSS